jgi:hypothetical protein
MARVRNASVPIRSLTATKHLSRLQFPSPSISQHGSGIRTPQIPNTALSLAVKARPVQQVYLICTKAIAEASKDSHRKERSIVVNT